MKLNVEAHKDIKIISGSKLGKSWAKDNNLANIDEKISIEVPDHIVIIARSFFEGIFEYLVENDCEGKKYNISFENSKHQKKYKQARDN